jgi:hypothetical protein
MQALNFESPHLRCPGPVNEFENFETDNHSAIFRKLTPLIIDKVKITYISAILRGKGKFAKIG